MRSDLFASEEWAQARRRAARALVQHAVAAGLAFGEFGVFDFVDTAGVGDVAQGNCGRVFFVQHRASG